MKYFKVILPLFLCISCAEISTSYTPKEFSQEEWKRNEMILLRDSLSLEEKAGQVLMISIDGSKRFSELENFHIKDISIGSILFFKKNISDNAIDLALFLESITSFYRSHYSFLSPLFAIDHEGGLVHRLKNNATHLPSAHAVATTLSEEQATSMYFYSGSELTKLGFHLNLAPVVEISNEIGNDFLGTRTYGSDPSKVFLFASAAIRGYKKAGIAISLKHFPGNTNDDPHQKLPIITHSRQDFFSQYVSQFSNYFVHNPESILLSNIIVTSIDPLLPFCFSYEGVTGILRNTLHYDGVCITDDIAMESVKKAGLSSVDAALLALEAGCDIIMTSDTDIRALVSAIVVKAKNDKIFLARLDESVLRILLLKNKFSVAPTSYQRNYYSQYKQSTESSFDSISYNNFVQKTKAFLEDLHVSGNR